jgi:hypothetical protein
MTMPLAAQTNTAHTDHILSRILVLRGVRVILDADLAMLYGVTTKRLNEQVKRNAPKFPDDFCFKLTAEELTSLRSHFATSKIPGRGGRRVFPNAFTEYGAIQAANVLQSDAAIKMGVQVVRAFVHLRQMIVSHKALSAKLAELEARVGTHDEHISAIIETLKLLTSPVGPKHNRRIGFST